jgi:hypothetical protein
MVLLFGDGSSAFPWFLELWGFQCLEKRMQFHSSSEKTRYVYQITFGNSAGLAETDGWVEFRAASSWLPKTSLI